MVTPIHDTAWQAWSTDVTKITDALTEYKAEPFQDYLSRGWCRLEMFFNANIPLDASLKRHKMFDGKLRQVMKEEGRRPHLLFGTRELMRVHEEPVMLRVQDGHFNKYHPGGKDAVTVDPRDKAVIGAYVQDLRRINRDLTVCLPI